MKIKPENYTSEFKEVREYCEKNRLFVGEGNPNAKILFVGKEINGGIPDKNADPVAWIKDKSTEVVDWNIIRWSNPDGYDLGKLETDIFCDHKNPTWTNYQKLVSGIIGRDLGRDNYNFLDHCFMTELSDIHLPNSNFPKTLPDTQQCKEVEALRKKSLQDRAELLSKPFFCRFPIVIMGVGHYPMIHKFDIEKVFGVGWIKETTMLSTGNFYNKHYGPDKILIHTRQMSTGVSDELISKIASLCISFWK